MKILSKTKGSAREYARWSVNPYLGCPHQCTYCYLQNGRSRKVLGGDVVHLKKGVVSEDHAYYLAMAEIFEHENEIRQEGGLFMSFTTDPMCGQCRDLFMHIIHETLLSSRIPVVVLTKVIDIWAHELYCAIECLNAYDYQCPIAFGWTLTGHDEMEPNAPTNQKRIECMAFVHRGGFRVWASIEPVIDFPSSLRMVEQALEAGCIHFKIGLQTYGNKVLRKMYDHDECRKFIGDVMHITSGKATVYWKQSIRTFLGKEDYARATVGYPGVVEADWNMFEL